MIDRNQIEIPVAEALRGVKHFNALDALGRDVNTPFALGLIFTPFFAVNFLIFRKASHGVGPPKERPKSNALCGIRL